MIAPPKGLRVVCISDTHGHHAALDIPEADVLVHAGDFALQGNAAEIGDFGEWLAAQPHANKLVIAGNHDRLLEEQPKAARGLLGEVHYLSDSGVELCGLRFWGSPWQPEFGGWAFNLPPGEPLARKWQKIPTSTDVLVTHCPPNGLLDRIHSGIHIGCPELLHVVDLIKPRLHVFGHAHEGAGTLYRGETWFANAAACDLHYRPAHPPLLFEWSGSEFTRVLAS